MRRVYNSFIIPAILLAATSCVNETDGREKSKTKQIAGEDDGASDTDDVGSTDSPDGGTTGDDNNGETDASDDLALSYKGAKGAIGAVDQMMSVKPTELSEAMTSCAFKGNGDKVAAGLSVDPATCEIKGTPSEAMAPTEVEIEASNAAGVAASAKLILEVEPAGGWVTQFGVASDQSYGQEVATNAAREVFFAGRSTGALEGAKIGTSDAFLAKYDSLGQRLWFKKVGEASKTYWAEGVVATSDGGAILLTKASSPTSTKVTRFDADGEVVWSKKVGVDGFWAYDMAMAKNGDIYIAGVTTTAQPGTTKKGTNDLVVVKVSADGTVGSFFNDGKAGSTFAAVGLALLPDESGLVVSGHGSASHHGGAHAGTSSYVVARYDLDGTNVWWRQVGVGTGPTHSKDVVIGPGNAIYVVGEANGGLSGEPPAAANSGDSFVAKYSEDGTLAWSRNVGLAATNTMFNSVVALGDGTVVASGYRGTAAFVLAMDEDGSKLWEDEYCEVGSRCDAQASAVDATGHLLIVGEGGLPDQTMVGTFDAWLMKLDGDGNL